MLDDPLHVYWNDTSLIIFFSNDISMVLWDPDLDLSIKFDIYKLYK